MQLDDWYNGLGPDPGPVADRVYEGMTGLFTDIKDGFGESSIQYSMTKRALGPVNLVIGTQYQFNLHWQLRAELQMLGGAYQWFVESKLSLRTLIHQKS